MIFATVQMISRLRLNHGDVPRGTKPFFWEITVSRGTSLMDLTVRRRTVHASSGFPAPHGTMLGSFWNLPFHVEQRSIISPRQFLARGSKHGNVRRKIQTKHILRSHGS